MEDKHIQLTQDISLYDYDLILRVNDDRTEYISFDIFDNKKQEYIFSNKLKDVAWKLL